jgi:hypothetical protein
MTNGAWWWLEIALVTSSAIIEFETQERNNLANLTQPGSPFRRRGPCTTSLPPQAPRLGHNQEVWQVFQVIGARRAGVPEWVVHGLPRLPECLFW